ncbi:hypothetical protein KCU99_g7346, partial [Aureobasidium melanogenum]
MASLPEQQMISHIIDPQFLGELEEHLRPHDGAFFWAVKVLDEHYCQKSISIEALWAWIYMTLCNTGTLVLKEECERSLLPEGCDVERLDAIATEIAQYADQPGKVEVMLGQLGIPIQKWDWDAFDNKCRLGRLSGLQPARLQDTTLGARHDLLAKQPAHIGNTTLSQHLAELNNNSQVTSSVASSQPSQTDHLNAAQQTNNFPSELLDPQLKQLDLESIMSRNEVLASKSSWKKTPMQLPAPSPNFPVSDIRNEDKGKQSMGPPPPPQHIDGPYVEALHKPVESPDAHVEPLSPVRAPDLTGLPPQKQAELVLQQLRDLGERQKARDGKYRSVADELRKGQAQAQKEGGDVDMDGK